MYNNHRVVVVTPAGRRRYLEVLMPYIVRSGVNPVDEWRLWVNTTNQDDISWMEAQSRLHPDFIKLEYPTEPVNEDFQAYSISQFFKNCTDDNTIYIRMDDDIVYVNPTAIGALCYARLEYRVPFLISANIINNSICSHLHQRIGQLTYEYGAVSHTCLDPLGWASGEFAKVVHDTFFKHQSVNKVYRYSFSNWILNPIERFSINCFAFLGSDFKAFGGDVALEEEEWLSVTKPRELNRPLMIAGNAVVSHFAYFTQRSYLDETNILARYKALSKSHYDRGY